MIKGVLQSWVLSVLILILIAFVLSSILNLNQKGAELDKTIANLSSKIDEVQSSRASREELGDFAYSQTYLERQARERLNYKKPDEKLVLVYRASQSSDSIELSEGNEQKKNWQKWWNYVIGR